MRYYLLLFILLLSSSSFGQITKGFVEGTVYDAKDSLAISHANIKLLTADSVFVEGVLTDNEGEFKLTPPIKNYLLEVSALGYVKQFRSVKLNTKNDTVKLGNLYLSEDAILLGEAEILGKIPPVQVKGDTIEFNAGSYNVDGSTVLKDLIKQIPGLELDQNGLLKANGKVISKILVDGKEYFGNDISMALSTLPASMITKLQLFKKESEEAQATGIKDEDAEQVLNLEVKEEFKRSIFGDTKSGVGNKGRHTDRFNLNKMHGDNQFALVGDINNINDSEYNYFNNFDNNIDKSIGANYNIQQSEKITFNGSLKYDNNKSMEEYESKSYTSILNQYTERTGKSTNRRQNLSFNSSLNWKLDSLTTIFLRTNAGYTDGNTNASSVDSMQIINKSRTSSYNTQISDNKSFNINNYLMVSRKLNDKGRNITLSIRQDNSYDDGIGTNYSQKIYWGENNNLPNIIDQISNSENKRSSYGLTVRYVEPISEANKAYVSYSANVNHGDRDNDVRKRDDITGAYTDLDEDYSRTTSSYSMRQSIKIGFQRSIELYDFNTTLSIDPSYTRNKIMFIDELKDYTKQNVANYRPTVYFRWKKDKDTNIDFNYQGETSHPSVSQLSSDVVIQSATSKIMGNPNLKPSFTNNINLSFYRSNFETEKYFSANLSYAYTFSNTVGYQIVDEHSNVTNTYRNVDGNSTAYAYATFSTPLKNRKINVGSSLNVSYMRNIGFINDQKNVIDRISLSPSINGRFNSSMLEANVSLYVNHSLANNNLADVRTSNTTDYRTTTSFKLNLPLHFALESSLDFSYLTGLGEGVKKDETLWNIAVSKQFLKDNKGLLKFQFFDLLNDLRTREYITSGSDYSDSWRKVINNYFMLSFSYRFLISQNKK